MSVLIISLQVNK